MEQNNLTLLADISFEGKNYADSYAKYSQIIESDINNLDAWIGKGLSAGFLSTAEKEALSEVATILNHISKQNLSDEQNNKVAENIILMCRDYISKLVLKAKDDVLQMSKKPMASGELVVSRDLSNRADRFESNNKIYDRFKFAVEFSFKSNDYNPSVETKKGQINLIDKFLSETNNEIHRDKHGEILAIRKKIIDEVKLKDPSYVSIEIAPKSDGCYIATHVYGNYDDPNVLILRNFRDTVLKRYKLGVKFINIYYNFSPKLVSRFYNKPTINKFIKTCILNPLTYLMNKK
jgi:hypothetical protein